MGRAYRTRRKQMNITFYAEKRKVKYHLEEGTDGTIILQPILKK
jgi:hypothetical protein